MIQKQKKQIAIVAGITAIAMLMFAMTITRAVFYVPADEVPFVPPTNMNPPRVVLTQPFTTPHISLPEDYPARLIVPSLHIDSVVQYTGVNSKGNMGVPTNFTDVAWYKYGTVPGEIGSAVIAGHVDNGLGLAGVFKHLDELLAGDDIYIETKGGKKLHFIVTTAESYSYLHAPKEQVFEAADTARLNLVTCAGRWMSKDKTYDRRIVVFAKLQ